MMLHPKVPQSAYAAGASEVALSDNAVRLVSSSLLMVVISQFLGSRSHSLLMERSASSCVLL